MALKQVDGKEKAKSLMESAYAEMRASRPLGAAHYDRAVEVLPRGTTRARFWEPMPLYVERAEGPYLYDIDGREYIDCNLGQGVLILGNVPPVVVGALQEQARLGVHYGPASLRAFELAELIVGALPGAERVTFTNSGTEATLGALRIARAVTGRPKVAKFEGGWHGSNEYVLHSFTTVSGDPRHADANVDSAGVSEGANDAVVVLPFNDERAYERIREEAEQLACVIIEPVLGGAGCLPASREFLEGLRRICDEVGALLILDEVVTGFRLGPQSAAGLYGVTADLTTLGKAIGGGQPVGAICGKADLMEILVHPRQGSNKIVGAGGTFSGNPMTMVGGIAELTELLEHPEHYERLDQLGARLRDGLARTIAKCGLDAHVTGIGSMYRVHITPTPPKSMRDLRESNHFANTMLRIYLELEGVLRGMGFVSTADSENDVDRVIDAYEAVFKRLEADGCL